MDDWEEEDEGLEDWPRATEAERIALRARAVIGDQGDSKCVAIWQDGEDVVLTMRGRWGDDWEYVPNLTGRPQAKEFLLGLRPNFGD